MKLTKRTLTMIAALVLCAAMTIGGTLAFLQDATNEVANVMTVGNVMIEQNEVFEQNSSLIPVVGDNNKVQKEITVTNTGSNEAYVRTLVAFDMGTMSEEDFLKYVKWSYNTDSWTQGTPYIDDNGRYVVPFTYNDVLAAGATTPASLTQVWLDSAAGNDQVAQLANDEGKYTVYALSQAVQTQGFADADTALNTAFGTPGAIPMPTPEIEVSNQAELIAAIQNPDIKVIGLKAGTYSVYPHINKAGQDISFVGVESDVILDETGIGNENNGGDIAFYNVTVNFANDDHKGFAHITSIKYIDCNINGKQCLYGDAEFVNCELTNDSDYPVWTYGSTNATFKNCTFTTGGRAILVYNESKTNSFVADIELNKCHFIDNGTYTEKAKAAVEAGSDGGNTATSNKYNLTFTDCTTDGFETNKSTSPLWGNKNSMDQDHLNVVIDGVDVY